MMHTPSNALVAAALVTCAHAAFAAPDEARVLANIRKAYPGTSVERVQRTPMPGVYEVWMGANVAFVSAGDPRYMVFGRMLDLKTMRDLTVPKLRAESPGAPVSQDYAGGLAQYKEPMPVTDAVTLVRGTGRRVLSVFTDPACGYCRQLELELKQLKDVTIHYYLLPFQGTDAPLAVWCAKDRVAAYAAAMGGVVSSRTSGDRCAHPLDRNRALAERLRVQATPTLLFPDGTLQPGVMSAGELEARLTASLVRPDDNKGERDASATTE